MNQDKLPTIEGLDGIRALAVTAVILFHADLNHFLPGGFLGVDVFFVLSGFLITSLLFRELENTGTISFAGFYMRRSKRLLAALLTVLFACAVYTSIFAHDAIRSLRGDIPPALLYYSNIWQLIDAQPYFERFGRPHALQHLWSLAIEEQFYILWPVLVILIFRLRKIIPPSIVIGFLGLCSIAWMWWLAELYNIPYENKPERLYFGTDTHSIGLLLGALLGSCYRQGVVPPPAISWFWNLMSSVAFMYLLTCFLFVDEYSEFLYRGGFASVSLATVCLILEASRHGSISNIIFQTPLGEWIGKRSYSLYLWHWPVFVYFRPGDELPDNMVTSFLIRLGLTVVLSDATYRFIEQPIQVCGLKAFGRFTRMIFAGGCIAFMVSFSALYFHEDSHAAVNEMQAVVEDQNPAAEEVQFAAVDMKSTSEERQNANGEKQAEASDEVATTLDSLVAEPSVTPKVFISKGDDTDAYRLDLTDIRVTAIGDSVMLGAKSLLTRKLPITYFNAEVGRQGSDLVKLVKHLAEEMRLSEIVLIHIGTNGYIYEQNLKQILHTLHGIKKIVIINVHADRRWTHDNNILLRKYQKIHDNITLIDWNAASEGHPEYFVKDGIHLTGTGMAAYAEIARIALGVPELPNRIPISVARAAPVRKMAPSHVAKSTTASKLGDLSVRTEEIDSPPEEVIAPRNEGA